jgi:hypothetical protein
MNPELKKRLFPFTSMNGQAKHKVLSAMTEEARTTLEAAYEYLGYPCEIVVETHYLCPDTPRLHQQRIIREGGNAAFLGGRLLQVGNRAENNDARSEEP